VQETGRCLEQDTPLISEGAGRELQDGGREWQPEDDPELVDVHYFPPGIGKAIPYGIYDVGANNGFVSVGIDDTRKFAVTTIEAWWKQVGVLRYPKARELFITAVVDLIANTSNRGGRVVRARLDNRVYPIGKKMPAKEFAAINIEPHRWRGDWNYAIKPRKNS
jgi:hypothetical protein